MPACRSINPRLLRSPLAAAECFDLQFTLQPVEIYSLRHKLIIAFSFRIINLTQFIENTCNIYVFQINLLKTRLKNVSNDTNYVP